MQLEITPIDGPVGAQVRGADLARPLDDATFAAVEAAFDEHGVPVFRDQLITPAHHVAFSRRFGERGRTRARGVSEEVARRYPPVTHPIVRTHPRTGRKSLYVMRGDCTGIAGMECEEAQGLIAALADHIVRPEFVYRHRWRRGDVVMWDNCTVQHKAIIDYDLPQRRLIHRTTVAGPAPV